MESCSGWSWCSSLLNSSCGREGQTSCKELIEHAQKLPDGLDPYYQRITEEISQSLSPGGLQKSRRILMWISAANEVKRFTVGELWDAMSLHDNTGTDAAGENRHPMALSAKRVAIRSWIDFKAILEQLCGSFVEILPCDGERNSFQPGDRPRTPSGSSAMLDVTEESVVHLIHRDSERLPSNLESCRLAGLSSDRCCRAVADRLRRISKTTAAFTSVFPHSNT